jgi:hypothetical protein
VIEGDKKVRGYVIYGIAIVLYFIITRLPTVKAHRLYSKRYQLVWILGLIAFGTNELINAYGGKTIGGFFERGRDYETSYYVNLFPNDKSSKNYRVKSDILATWEQYQTDSGSDAIRVYYIQRAYFSDHNVVSFENAAGNQGAEDVSLATGKKVGIVDDSGRRWLVELTTEKTH